MFTRRKNERVVPALPPAAKQHGRLVPTAAARQVDRRDARVRLAESLVLARLDAAGVDVGLTHAALRSRLERAREDLGPEVSRRITEAFASGGPLVAMVARSHADVRAYAIEAAVTYVLLVDEHRVETTSALMLLGSASAWQALGRMLKEQAVSAVPGIVSVSKSTGGKGDEPRVTVGAMALGDCIKLAGVCSSQFRNDLSTALALEERSRQAGASEPAWPWVQPADQPEPEQRDEPAPQMDEEPDDVARGSDDEEPAVLEAELDGEPVLEAPARPEPPPSIPRPAPRGLQLGDEREGKIWNGLGWEAKIPPPAAPARPPRSPPAPAAPPPPEPVVVGQARVAFDPVSQRYVSADQLAARLAYAAPTPEEQQRRAAEAAARPVPLHGAVSWSMPAQKFNGRLKGPGEV
jgi:hypothetical protein